MSTDELRIAVAESLGWKRPDSPEAMALKPGWTRPASWWLMPDGRTLEFPNHIPNYPTSLDACREFEKTIPHSGPEPTICTYVRFLEEEQPHPQGTWATCLFATPEQRCRAWLKFCKGKVI